VTISHKTAITDAATSMDNAHPSSPTATIITKPVQLVVRCQQGL
jgi:hypothetical protein